MKNSFLFKKLYFYSFFLACFLIKVSFMQAEPIKVELVKNVKNEIKKEHEPKMSSVSEGDLEEMVEKILKRSIAYFDTLKILEHSEQYKDGAKKIEKEIERRRQEIRSLEETMMKKKSEFENLEQALNESARESRKEELMSMETKCRMKMQSGQEYLNTAEQKLRTEVLNVVSVEAAGLAKVERYLVVFAGGVIYGDESIDITDDIIEQMNTNYEKEKEKKAKKELVQKDKKEEDKVIKKIVPSK